LLDTQQIFKMFFPGKYIEDAKKLNRERFKN
jgi:hypothetical protein